MPLFKKKEKPETVTPGAAPAMPSGIPTDAVVQMRQQGYSNNQIIQALTDQGYSSSQIFDAMSQADIRKIASPVGEAASATPPTIGTEAMPSPSTEAPPEEVPGIPAQPVEALPEEIPREMPSPGAQLPGAQPATPVYSPAPTISKEEIEEIAESIIEEKWTDLMKSLEKVVEWKEITETKIAKIEQAIKDLKGQFEELHKGVLERISEYDKGIRHVGVNVKAMEEVFKKLLPQFTENVSELSKITKKAKKN